MADSPIKIDEQSPDVINDIPKIKTGDYVILRRGAVMLTVQVAPARKVSIKRNKFLLDNAVGCSYGTTFKINGTSLESVPHSELLEFHNEENDDCSEAKDNRDLIDDGKSQKLSRDDIEILKKKGLSGEEIIDQLVENSQTFKDKSEYSKIKYLKKKKQKYTNFVSIIKPTTRLLIDMYHSQGFLKILGLRMDSLAQMLTMGNVYSGGKFIVVDSCLGLVTGAILERLGGTGKLINMYIDNIPQYPVLKYYNFSNEEIRSLMYIDLNEVINTAIVNVDETADSSSLKKLEDESLREQRRNQRETEKKEALNLIKDGDMDGIIMACKQHPENILRSLMPYLASSRPFVVYCPYKQPLIDCYVKLKEDGNALMLNLSETWCRHYQVLSNRTHPAINDSGCSGYILSGIKAQKNIWIS